MANKEEKINKPSICIATSSSYKDSENSDLLPNIGKLLTQVGYGIEEEGVPYYLLTEDEVSAKKLAYKAAQISPLGIGVGVDSNENIVIQMSKLDEDTPVFDRRIKNKYEAKIMGSNAARMVKGLPFKDFSPLEQANLSKITEKEEQEIKSITKKEEISSEMIEKVSDLVTKIIADQIS